jgi:probable F420-dependent oxidoreductase
LVAQRDPIQTAKEVASLDVVSGGRFYFGAGVGWLREEMVNHGVEPSVRGRVVDERLRAMIAIWTQEAAEFHGEHVDFDPIHSWPKPIARPYPPLFLGGGRAGFRRIAELGAGWMPISVSAAHLADDLEYLRDVTGRDVPVICGHAGDATAEQIEAYRHLGVEHVALHLPTEPREPTLRRLDAIQAELAKIGLVQL